MDHPLAICADQDRALLDLAVERRLITAAVAADLHARRGAQSAAAALVGGGHLSAAAVRGLRDDLRRRAIPRAIDGYQLTEHLGSGGMAVVFKARDVVDGRTVAIKVVSPAVAGDHRFLERFQREARAASAVVHPNLIRCHGSGTCDGRAYLVLECMEGGDVEALLRRSGGALGEAQALAIARDCARALVAIAAHGLVHRDVKPANLFLDGDGNAKLADLGLAKSAAPDDQLTMPGTRVGSPGYMAPEQVIGGEADARSDIYALGATLYHLLAGRRPHPGRTPQEIILRSLREEPVPLERAAAWVSPAAAAIVTRAMARRPQDRYPDAAALLADLDAAIAGQPLPSLAARPPPAGGWRAWLRGWRRWFARGAVARE